MWAAEEELGVAIEELVPLLIPRSEDIEDGSF
jgi:hypothetical protein